MPIRIASWNVNSIRARLDHVLTWLADNEPDVLCLQETKVEDALFPRVPFLELGYRASLHGGRALAGVATLSKLPPSSSRVGFTEPPADRHPRILEVEIARIHLYNLYAPNGTEVGSDAFDYKLEWFARLRDELAARHTPTDQVLLVGDFNVAPDARDVWDAAYFAGRLQFTDAEHAALGRLVDWGMRDVYRELHPEGGRYSWFDYRTGGFSRNEGMRIDLALASEGLAARCRSVDYDDGPRGWETPSDHVPLVVTIDD